MTLEQIQYALKSDDVILERVARDTNLSRMTIVRLKRGDGNASYKTVKAVSDYFEGDTESE